MPKKKKPITVERTAAQKRLKTSNMVLDGKLQLNWIARHGNYAKYCRAALWDVEACRRAYINEPRCKKFRAGLIERFGTSEVTLSRAISRFGWNEQRREMIKKNYELEKLMDKAVEAGDLDEIKKLAYVQHSRMIDKFSRKVHYNLDKPDMTGKELADNIKAYSELMKITGEEYKQAQVAVESELVRKSGSTPGAVGMDDLEEMDRLDAIDHEVGPTNDKLPPGYSRDLCAEEKSRKATRNGKVQTERDEYEHQLMEKGKKFDREFKT